MPKFMVYAVAFRLSSTNLEFEFLPSEIVSADSAVDIMDDMLESFTKSQLNREGYTLIEEGVRISKLNFPVIKEIFESAQEEERAKEKKRRRGRPNLKVVK